MNNKWNILVFLLVICGIGVMGYPVFSNWLAGRNHTKLLAEYDMTAEQMSEDQEAEMLARAEAYNQSLTENVVSDPFAEPEEPEADSEYLSILNLNGVMSYIEIPVLDISLPVYHTSSETVLKRGAGHMENSSFPVGGEGTHAVITAHRGLPSAKLFTDLNKLEVGDYFRVKVLRQTLNYCVDQIVTVEPQFAENLQIEDGEDYITLVTCTPYAVNSHRLLVRGVRTEDIPEEEASEKKAVKGRLYLIVLIGSIFSGVNMLLYRNKRVRRFLWGRRK